MPLALIRQLFEHQAWADRELLRAVSAHAGAFREERLMATLQHIVFVQRVFHAMLTGAAFDAQKESQPVPSLAALEELYRASHASQLSLLDGLTREALDRPVVNPWVPGLEGTVGEILMQVILHSQNHRGQCLTRLRELTGGAPTLDFILWLRLGRQNRAAATMAAPGGDQQ